MNYLGKIPLPWKLTVLGVILIAAAAADHDEAGEMREVSSLMNESPTDYRPPSRSDAERTGGAREVQLVDKGMNMVISTARVPEGWVVEQDIAFDPQAGRHARFKLVSIGPRNQYLRTYVGTFPWGTLHNIPFDHAVNQAIEHVLAVEQLENTQFSQLSPSDRVFRDSRVREMAQRLARTGQGFESYELEFTGERGGKSYRGRIIFTNMFNPQGGFGVLNPNSMIFGLAEDYEELVRVADSIQDSIVPNSEYTQLMEQINHQIRQRIAAYGRQQMEQSAIAHQKRMADRQAAFNSHMRNMAGLNQLQDVAHESYMKTLRSNGSFSSIGSDYSGHDAFIDQTHERTSFVDPWSENEISLDGQYDYNYTNGLGDYYRTNDPSFDPASLQGDWRQIEPLE